MNAAQRYFIRARRNALKAAERAGHCYNTEYGILWVVGSINYIYDVMKHGLLCAVEEEDTLSDDLSDNEILLIEAF